MDARTGALGKNMKIFIVYCHPSEDSFTRHIRDSFIKGIIDSGNEYILSDLYKMNFNSDISERQYLRDANYNDELPVEEDIISEHEKINACDAIAFIYPVFWTEAPAKLVGWFDRVWSYGFAYGNKKMKMLEKGIILCSAGNPVERLEQFGLLSSMKRVMFGDRLFGRIKKSEFVLFSSTSREKEERINNWEQNLEKAYEKGRSFFATNENAFSLEDKFFTAIENSETGEVSENTIFSYHQKKNTIWAEYSGGKIKKGFLIGTIDKKNCLSFSYQHLNIDDEIKSGKCLSTPEILEDGKICYHENWIWDSGEKGTSVIKEI